MRIFENNFNSRKSMIKYRYFLMGQVEVVEERPVEVFLEALDADFQYNRFLFEVAFVFFFWQFFIFRHRFFPPGTNLNLFE